ncbi:MAG: DUF664 domain-containing protein [Chloroflexi bacterium]|nr:MAG: DUF664 domain-containing protein [Chloroflexota bacterium]
MATSVLDHVLQHNAWANKTLLEFCDGLEPAALDLSVPGTYGTLYLTLQHIVGGEQFYIRLLTGEVLGAPVRKTERRTLEDLVAISELTSARAIAIAARDDADRVIAPGDDQTTVGIVLAQLIHHGNEHRAQATTILGAHGRTTPKIGAWTYGIVNGISRNDGD